MSNNTTSKIGAAFSSVRYVISDRLSSYSKTRPIRLAYSDAGMPGADPAPGRYDGHGDWGNKLIIDPIVEEVRHFIAAHEVRNSFPVDSVSILQSGRIYKPEHFFETVYPGVHSDVGGSYAPGEGARAPLPSENLGVIPLIHMYNYALCKGVPLLPVPAWTDKNETDFSISADLFATYNHYVKSIGSSGSLGDLMNKNMGLYYAWRFRSIKLKMQGNKGESDRISEWSVRFKKDETALKNEISALERKEESAVRELNSILQLLSAASKGAYAMSDAVEDQFPSDKDVALARKNAKIARDDLLKAQARMDALPKMGALQEMIDLYDKQLLDDVRTNREPLSAP